MTVDDTTQVQGQRADYRITKHVRPLVNGDADGAVDDAVNGKVYASSWDFPGLAAFDFRTKYPLNLGDVTTSPTARMLSAIASTTLRDDDFQQDPTTLNLESWIAKLTGKEAGLLVVSGTMGNQISIRTHLQGPPHSVVADHRAHIFTHEAGGVASMCGAMTIPVEPSNGNYLTLEDLEKKTITRFGHVTDCPAKLISLEVPLGGVIMPLSECQRISNWAREHGIIMHLDGARLWEAVAAGAGSLKDYCACFDSVNLCFSKGLGAPIGSIIVGTRSFRERARWIRKSIGGGLRQSGVICGPARVAVEDTFLGGKLQESHTRAREIARIWEAHGGKLTYPVETNMVWLDLGPTGTSLGEFIEKGEALGLALMGPRLVVHYQICDEAVRRLEILMQSLLARKNESNVL